MRTKRHMSFFPINIWWIRDMSMQTCLQGARCAIKSTLLDRLFQTRVGHQEELNVLTTATFSLTGRPNGWSALPGKPVATGAISLIGTALQAFGSGFLSRFVERVLCMINAPKQLPKC